MKRFSRDILDRIKHGDKRPASEFMSLIESGEPEGKECLKGLGGTAKEFYVFGVTGWTGGW